MLTYIILAIGDNRRSLGVENGKTWVMRAKDDAALPQMLTNPRQLVCHPLVGDDHGRDELGR